MKKLLVVVLACFEFIAGQAQTVPAVVALEGKKTLQERYYLMKVKSESYQDYKVIKEGIMDGVWKIVNDSLSKREQQLDAANAKIKSLQNEVSIGRTELKAKEDSMAGITYASTHINVLGVNFGKGFFITLAAIGMLALTATILLLLMRIKAMQVFVKESKLIIDSTSSEFEDYKRKAFEKQTKLTRELQTERNKLMELMESRKAM